MMTLCFHFFLTMFLSCCVSGDVDVSCGFLESCVLPCVFTPGDDPVIHWTKEPKNTPVYSYYKNQHQLQHQHENYRNRTFLSDQGISTGDASLQLHKVKVHDEGRYKCYISTIRPNNVKESFVNLKVYDNNNVLCIWNQTCTLPCPFQGEFTEASWSREGNTVPIIVKPPGQWHHLHHDYRNITSMPGGGAALDIRGVELKHQGLHRCSVIFRNGKIDRLIDLNVHAPVLNVSVRQEGQELICRAEMIYPEPTVDWTLPSSDSNQTQTLVNTTEDGLYSVSSSVRLPPNSTAESLTCTISTPYSWGNATVITQGDTAPDNPNLHNPWIWTLFLILLIIIVGLLMFWLKKSRSLNFVEVPSNDPKMSHDDESGASTEPSDTSCSVRESTDSTAPLQSLCEPKQKCVNKNVTPPGGCSVSGRFPGHMAV